MQIILADAKVMRRKPMEKFLSPLYHNLKMRQPVLPMKWPGFR